MAYTLTAKSQVTLPKPIRDHLKVAPGDAVEFRIKADGSVQVEPVRSVSDSAALTAAAARIQSLRGSMKTGRSTDDWMNMLRGYDEDMYDPGFGGTPRPGDDKPSSR